MMIVCMLLGLSLSSDLSHLTGRGFLVAQVKKTVGAHTWLAQNLSVRALLASTISGFIGALVNAAANRASSR